MNARSIIGVHRRVQAVYVFPSAQAMVDALRGPQQHDQHVKTRATHLYFIDQAERLARADAAVRAYLAEQGVKV